MSTDDKAKVHIGKTAAKAQAPMLMHVAYKIRLPDHDFNVGDKHKITPSVYAVCEILENGKYLWKYDSYICCMKYFTHLSGLYIKFGQGIATMNHVLPKEYTETLQILQDKCLRRESSDEIYQVFCTNHRDIWVY